jgi:hypothetical protein
MKVQICNIQLDEDFHAYAHTREDGSIMDYIWMAAFEGSTISSKIRSIKGVAPTTSQTGANEITYAANNGSLWGTQTWSQINMINMLLIPDGQSLNTQPCWQRHYDGGSQGSHLLKTARSPTRRLLRHHGNVAMKVIHIENYFGDA